VFQPVFGIVMNKGKDILICVKTYPEYSVKYTETVCIAGILKDSRRLIRLYPITYRYLEGDMKFEKYQWINAIIEKNPKDSRPESYKVHLDSIHLGESVDTSGNWEERKYWVLAEQNIFKSLETLLAAQETKRTSLGLIKVREMIRFEITEKTKHEIEEAETRKEKIIKQLAFFEVKKDLELLPFRFTLHFLCDDKRCKGHRSSILDWEFGELYRKVKGRQNWKELIQQKVDQIFSFDRDTHLFMGNMMSHPHAFSVLGFFWPEKERQYRLF
jgi:hypothetical protein